VFSTSAIVWKFSFYLNKLLNFNNSYYCVTAVYDNQQNAVSILDKLTSPQQLIVRKCGEGVLERTTSTTWPTVKYQYHEKFTTKLLI